MPNVLSQCIPCKEVTGEGPLAGLYSWTGLVGTYKCYFVNYRMAVAINPNSIKAQILLKMHLVATLIYFTLLVYLVEGI